MTFVLMIFFSDPKGVLGEGEVHIKRSHLMIGPDSFETETVLGDVLVSPVENC